jgi:glutaredoxin 3
MRPVTLYTTEACPFCTSANLARDPDSRAQLQERTGMFTFPQIIIGDEPIGGFTELLAADKTGRLKELLAA